ncbi:MAG: hypothetical protein NT142_14595 [Planctomycetota bacterium]|nr:hypothetical protein [Planctomycetota bacterium]
MSNAPPSTTSTSVPEIRGIPEGLPEKSEIKRILFSPITDLPQDAKDPILMEFSQPTRHRATLSKIALNSETGFEVLLVPTGDTGNSSVIALARDWVDAPESSANSLMLTLHGAVVLWRSGRSAILANPERMDSVLDALMEFSFYELHLRKMEGEIGAGWIQLEQDSPLAFDFTDTGLSQRSDLKNRFKRAISLRGQLARVTPQIHHPPVYPPTLRSQVAERLRERTRLTERLEFLGGQLEVFERVYEMCGQRASEFSLARKGHTLEMILILLLALQTLFLIFDLLSATGTK